MSAGESPAAPPRSPRIDARGAWALARDSVLAWIEDRAPRKGAALAFYTLFSLAPILLIAINIAALFFGAEAARGEVVGQIRGLVGEPAALAIEGMLRSAELAEDRSLAAVFGVLVLLVGATSALAELKDGLDQIWRVPPQRTMGLAHLLRTRLVSLAFIMTLAFLLLVSLVVSAALAALARYMSGSDFAPQLLRALNLAVGYGLVTALFAAIYKILPGARIAWHDVIAGAAVTAALFTVGKFAIGEYLGTSAVTSVYGAAGSVILVMLWVYWSALIFFVGAEFTRLYSHRYGSRRSKDPQSPNRGAGP